MFMLAGSTLDQTTAEVDVVVLGAGPAGCLASARLRQLGHRVLCVEKLFFPRHVIGQSLLPRCNQLLRDAGLLDAVLARGYTRKHGATFLSGDKRERFAFADALTDDDPWTFQVPRDDFDRTLATEVRRQGVDLRFGHAVRAVTFAPDHALARDYEAVMRDAVAVFRAFVKAWYDGRMSRIFFTPQKPPRIKRRITSILAGSVRRADNPMVRDPEAALHELYRMVVEHEGATRLEGSGRANNRRKQKGLS
jgi:hypothetical protein